MGPNVLKLATTFGHQRPYQVAYQLQRQGFPRICTPYANRTLTARPPGPQVKELGVIPLFREAGQAGVGRAQEVDFSRT